MGALGCIVHFDGRPVSTPILQRVLAAARHRAPFGFEVAGFETASFTTGSSTAASSQAGHGASAQLAAAVEAAGTSPQSVSGSAALAAVGETLICADVRLDGRDVLIRRLLDASASQGRELLDLVARGTDAELILAAWLCWGEDCVEQLLGDFAFVVWDGRARRLFAARDIAGVKPLAYAGLPKGIALVSEAQQLLRHPEVSSALDEVSIALHLVNRGGDGERSLFDAVQYLPPGHALSVGADAPVRTWRYWRPETLPLLRLSRTEDYAAHFREQLDLAVADRLRDVDTKAAVLMSGGMDSTSVAALASLQVGSSRLRAFSYRFDRHRRSDEGPFIEAMASTFGLRVENLAAESFPFFGDPEQLSIDLETPFRGWEPPLSYVLQRMRAAGHRVLLTGHGGDNAPRGSAHLYADELLRRPWRTLGQIRGHSRDFAIPVSRLLRVCVVSPWLRSLPRQELWRRLGRREPKLPKWIATDFARRTDLRRRIVESSPAFGVRGHARCQVVSLVSPWGPVARAVSAYDRLVCHYRVEARHPFLDRRVVEAAICTPPDQLFHRGRFKVLVRRAVPELPTSVRERHWKTSFRPYFDAALRHESWIEDMLSRPLLSARLGFVEPKRLRRSLQEFLQTEKSEGHPSFAVTLELWLRQLAAVAGAIF